LPGGRRGLKCRFHRGFRPKRGEQARQQAQHDHRHTPTLHDHAPNTYYGHWLAKNAGKHAAKWAAIAHNELVASPGIAPFDGAERDFPGNRSPARWNFICRPKENLRARRRRAPPATTPPLTASL
jgi:hypothetical protein